MAAKSKYFPKKLNHPPKDEVWIHIDHFDKKSKNYWALQWWEAGKLYYRVAKQWAVFGGSLSGTQSGQPSAVIRCPLGKVTCIAPYVYRVDYDPASD